MRAELDDHYTQCKACTDNRISRAQKPNEVDMTSLFENFFPGSSVQFDFAERGNDEFWVLCCQMSGVMQMYKTRNESTEQNFGIERQ